MKSIVGGSARRAVKTGQYRQAWNFSYPGQEKKSTLLLVVAGEEKVSTTADHKDAARRVGYSF